MANYPLSQPVIDQLGTTLANPAHSGIHDTVRDELLAVATELGLDPAGTFGTLRARLDDARLGRSEFYRAESIASGPGASGLGVDVPFTSEVRDDDGWGSAGSSVFVCPEVGLYAVGVECVIGSAGNSFLRVHQNTGALSANQLQTNLATDPPAVGRVWMFAAGEELRVRYADISPGTISQVRLVIQRLA